MATLTLNQPNGTQLYADYSGYNSSSYIDETSSGWYVMYEPSGIVYGAFQGTGITYDTYGNPILGTITSASCLDSAGALLWTVSQPGIAANGSSNMRGALSSGNPFIDYMRNTILKDNDTIIGSSGNDIIFYTSGSDTVNGGGGIDWMDFSPSNYNAVVVNLLQSTYRVTVSNVVITSTISNVENIVGTGQSDTLTGNGVNNVFIGGNGNDLIDGGLGADTASYERTLGVDANLTNGVATEKYTSYGSTYTDTLSNIENLTGSTYNDILTGDSGANVLTGGAGNDTLDGRLGVDTADYSAAYRSVTVNLVTGVATGHGTDALSNIENVNGSTYGDTLFGNNGANRLNGNGGNDFLTGGAGNDVLMGGVGIDQARYNTASSAVTVNLSLLTAQDTGGAGFDTLSEIENLLGGNFNDTLTGDGLANKLEGGNGDDTLIGGAGNDILVGGAGKDALTGGAGVDSFVFNLVTDSSAGANKDTVTDFAHGVDKISLSAIDANVFVPGDQAFTLISSSAGFSAPGQLKFSDGILSGVVTGSTSADFQIALTGVTTFSGVDMIL